MAWVKLLACHASSQHGLFLTKTKCSLALYMIMCTGTGLCDHRAIPHVTGIKNHYILRFADQTLQEATQRDAQFKAKCFCLAVCSDACSSRSMVTLGQPVAYLKPMRSTLSASHSGTPSCRQSADPLSCPTTACSLSRTWLAKL